MRGPLVDRFAAWLEQPVLRLELIRVLAPLAILGFMSSRIAHADEWLGAAGFRVPDLGGDWRQPVYVPALPVWACWSVVGVVVISGLFVTAGFRTRPAAALFALSLAFVALADRLAAFTVSKLAPALVIALAFSPCGARFGVDAWLRQRRDRAAVLPESASGVRFFQLFLPIFYSASGIAKLRGDWLSAPDVLWTHLHDSYQTWAGWALANSLPAFTWALFQGAALIFEVGAPLWFGFERTRRVAFYAGLTMHGLIGILFGPVIWFALLMIVLLIGAYVPDAQLERLRARLASAGW